MTGSVVDDGFPDPPMLDELTVRALDVPKKQPKGFVLMVEGASIDKQTRNMDTERWMLDTIAFDRAIGVAQAFTRDRGDALVIVTADHECSDPALIGGSMVTDDALRELAQARGTANLRDKVVGVLREGRLPVLRHRRGRLPTGDGHRLPADARPRHAGLVHSPSPA